MKKRGEAGIGTLILLIALVLVAAIAASVLLQTSGSLQSKALATGSKTQAEVSTQIVINRIYGEDGSTGTLNYIYVDMRLGPGSDPLNLNDTLVDFSLSDSAVAAIYQQTYVQCNQPTIDTIVGLYGSNYYGVEYLIKSQTQIDGYLQQGDVIRICFAPPRVIDEKETFRLTVLPKNGLLSQAKSRTPDIITEGHVDLFPLN